MSESCLNALKNKSSLSVFYTTFRQMESKLAPNTIVDTTHNAYANFVITIVKPTYSDCTYTFRNFDNKFQQ